MRRSRRTEAQIFKVVDDRRKLEERAQADPRLLGGACRARAVAGR
jgi:hypothetical protein